MITTIYSDKNFLAHHGIKGQKWGVRRFQNEDGSLTPDGIKRYYNESKFIGPDGSKAKFNSLNKEGVKANKENSKEMDRYIRDTFKNWDKKYGSDKVLKDEVDKYKKAISDYKESYNERVLDFFSGDMSEENMDSFNKNQEAEYSKISKIRENMSKTIENTIKDDPRFSMSWQKLDNFYLNDVEDSYPKEIQYGKSAIESILHDLGDI